MEEKLKNLSAGKAVLIGLGLAVLYYFSMYNDGAALELTLASNRAAIAQKTTELNGMKKTLEDAKRHQAVAAQLGKDLEQVLSAVPVDYNSMELMKLVSAEAKSAGLNILVLKGEEGKATDPGKNFIPVKVAVSLSGTFNQMMMFMSNLTKVGKVILAKNVVLGTGNSVNNASASTPIMAFSASLEAYRYDPKGDPKGLKK